MDQTKAVARQKTSPGSVAEAIVFAPGKTMCSIFFLPKSCRDRAVVPIVYEYFYDDENLAALLRANSREQNVVRQIILLGGKYLVSTATGTIMDFNLPGLPKTEQLDYCSFSKKNIEAAKRLVMAAEIEQAVAALIYWPKTQGEA
ncbi:MAG: hypothetical protein PHE24_00220 [Patescibacteria group bacterium]|nr:hypothetical protein [Patescibacteria group bacterium]